MSRVGAGAATLALLAFAGTAPAGAAAGETLYTATSFEVGQGALGTIDLNGPTFTSLGTDLPSPYFANGIDLFGDTGYGIAASYDDNSLYYVYTWDRNTGVITTPVLITQTFSQLPITAVFSADTLADGTLIALLGLDDGDPVPDPAFVVSIDPVTGIATNLVDLTGAAAFLDSLATDSTTGKTYAFVDEDDGMPQYLELDLVNGTYTGPTDLTGINDAFGGGYVSGADFNSNGTLYFFYVVLNDPEPDETLLAATSEAFSATAGADFLGGGTVSVNVEDVNLTVHTPVVKLADTGLPVSTIIVGGIALIGIGLGAVYITRRRAVA
jgi:hypothetical protein